jgi:ferrous iron transport protein B
MSTTTAVSLDHTDQLVVLEGLSQRVKKIALVGHPNVGKSVLFSTLTSRYVTVSNFPGTTVEVFSGEAQIGKQIYKVFDTPGINSTEPNAEDERVTLEVIQQERPDIIIQVADAKNLRRALLLLTQLSEFKIPIVLVLNMMDECKQRGIHIDSSILSLKLGVPVVETVATTGHGLEELKRQLNSTSLCPFAGQNSIPWVEGIMGEVHWQRGTASSVLPLQTRLFVVASLLGAFLHIGNYLGHSLGFATLADYVSDLVVYLLPNAPETLTSAFVTIIAYLLPVLLPVLMAIRWDTVFKERFGVWARRPSTGLFILATAISLTYQLVGNLGAQTLVEIFEVGLFESYITPFFQNVVPEGFFYDLLVGQYGVVSMGLAYGLAIVLPVVSTFFLAFSFLEDCGYLPRLSILSDRILRAMGLHGKGFLPMVLGLGCVTMATMTTRILSSKKERFIATLLLALGIPCSAQLGVILAITSGISGQALAIVFVTVLLQLVLVGHALARIYPGRRSSFVLELPPIRWPVWTNIAKKTYWRVRWFLAEAVPLFALGALVLFFMDRIGLLTRIIRLAEPVVTKLLGLPAESATVFLMGFLRRDYGAAGLFEMSRQGQLDTTQTVIGLVVMTLFVPCIANFFVMIKEQGTRNTLLMVGFILLYAVAVGAALHWAFRVTGITL